MVNSNRTFLAYLDILGYRNIINEQSPRKFYAKIIECFKDLKLLQAGILPKEKKTEKDIHNEYTGLVLEKIKFSILGDAIIVSCNFEDVKKLTEKYYEKSNAYFTAIALFSYTVATFVSLFIKTTGYLLRGGVDIGQFYEDKFPDDLLKGNFVFSKALVGAYILEQEAIYPRILVSKRFYRLWRKEVGSVALKSGSHKNLIRQANDGVFYIDYYETFSGSSSTVIKLWVDNVLLKVPDMLRPGNQVREEVKRKWFWFKDYHNSKIKEFASCSSESMDDLLIT